MKKIAFAFIAAMAVLSFAGCKKKDPAKEAMAKMEGFKNDMCKCKAGEKACAEKVEKDMKAWMESMKGKEKDMKSSPEDEKKGGAIMTDLMKCQQAAMGAGDMAAPPAGDKPAGDKPADPAAAPPAGDKPADPAAAPPAGDKPAGDMKKEEPKK